MSFTSFGFNLPYPTTIFDMSKELFPQPGQNNFKLVKVTCSLESDGIIKLYRKKNSKVSLRGTQYDIPKSQSKKDKPFIYCEDQLMKEGLQQQLARQKKQEEYRLRK